MPNLPYVAMPATFSRKDPLGPGTVNQLQVNVEAIDEIARIEHFADGQHNALEVPWVLGHVTDGATPTGTLFDTTYGGSAFTRPATGEYTVDVVSGVVTSDSSSNPLYAALANVADAAIESKPHTITVEPVSATSFRLRIRALTSALGAGDTWADANRGFDFALHALAKPQDSSLLLSHDLKMRGNYLTQDATDWSALAENQGIVRKAQLLEHTSAGAHNVNRIARAVAWCNYSPTTYAFGSGSIGVKTVSRISTGVIEVIMDDNFTSNPAMACFPEVQPATPNELVIINGRGFNTGSGTSAFRFFIYAFDGTNWSRADRTFFTTFFGTIA